MSLFEKIFGKNKKIDGKPGRIVNEALPEKEVNQNNSLNNEKNHQEKKPTSAAAFRANEFQNSEIYQEIIGGNIVDFKKIKKEKEAQELQEKIEKVKLLYDFYNTAKKNGITDSFALGELASNQNQEESLKLEFAAEVLVSKKSQKELLEAAQIPKEEQQDLIEMADKIILMNKVKARETLKHLG